MNAPSTPGYGLPFPSAWFACDTSLRTAVGEVLAAAGPLQAIPDRRRYTRYAYARPIFVTPVDGLLAPLGAPVRGMGKHLSEDGIGFFHFEPLAHRRAVISLEHGAGEWLSFELLLRWCRFIRHGWYESGGRLIRPVPSPQALPAQAG